MKVDERLPSPCLLVARACRPASVSVDAAGVRRGVDYLMAYPDADIYSFDGGALHKVAYEDTDHYRITRDFLNAPERFLRHLMPKPPTHG